MGVYAASESDLESVKKLFEELFIETRKFGSRIRPGKATSDWIETAFHAARGGAGACFVAVRDNDVVGVSLAVETPWPYDTDYGRTAFGLGTYVKPEYRKTGVADSLYAVMKRELRKKGFTTYMGGAHKDNTAIHGLLARHGGQMHEYTVEFDLEKS